MSDKCTGGIELRADIGSIQNEGGGDESDNDIERQNED